MPTTRQLPSVLLLVLGLVLTACASGGEPAVGGESEAADPAATAETSNVVVTTSILGDIAREVLGETGAQIEVLLPPGTDPHGYSPSASDGVTVREADLVVAIGLNLEEALLDTLDAAEADGVEVLRVGELVDPIEYGAGSDHADEDDHADEGAHADEGDHDDEGEHTEEEDGEHDHGDGPDPHVWLDPLRAAAIGQEIAAAYAELVPDAEGTVTAAADDYEAELVALDEELRAMVDTLPEDRRKLITNHDAIGYLADRYDLEVVATVLPGTSADVDVTAGAFTELVELLEETGIPAVFAETTSTDRLAKALAEEVEGVQVVELYTDSLGEPGSEADTVATMLRTDLERIVAALG